MSNYPFPRDQECTVFAPWWEWLGARLFGQGFDERSGPFHAKAYWWRGKLYLWRYGP